MPSPMSAPSDEVPPLTNDEIETLYDIVRDAQTLPDPPFRALFKAYDRVLALKNRNDDGGRYFTFLFRMQEDARQVDEGLVDRFKRVLAQQGIEVEIDPEGEGVEVTTNVDNALGGGSATTQNLTRRGPSRRGSFDSFLDGAADKVAGVDTVELPIRSRRGSVAASDTADLRHRRQDRPDADLRGPLRSHPPMRGRPNGHGTRRTASASVAIPPKRSSSVSSRGSLRIFRDGHTGTQQYGGTESSYSEPTDSFDRSHIQIPGVNAPLPGVGDEEPYGAPRTSYRPSDTQIERDAETFAYHRNLALERKYLQKWWNAMHERAQRRGQMEAAARAFDRSVLLRASLDSWRVALQARRQELETDRFFERLETRAQKARNLFLLTKAFTHWARSAEDEVQRTSTARRHILRTKYFKAWREITAVNELKIQHFVLAKFLDIWRSRTAAVREQNDLAVSLYHHNIVYRLYWQWFWKFGERRAPMLHRNRMARDTIRKWAEIVAILKEREAWATDQRNLHLLRHTLSKWREKTAAIRSQEAKAEEFRHSALVSSGFYALRKQASLCPLQAQVVARVEVRLVRTTFGEWHRDAQLSRRAREVDRLRVLRNAFTSWNDRLRINSLQEQINDRIQVQCLYKWALASRVSLFRRVHDHRLKETIFSLWSAKTQNRENTLEGAERRFAAFKRAQRLRFCLRKLETATAERRQQEYVATSVYRPRLQQRIFGKLLDKHAHLQELDTWADRANYYVTTKNALARWRAATEYARRNRRREAYAHIRRTVKLNLVRRTFGLWKEKAEQITRAQQQADEMATDRLLRTSATLLLHWQDSTSQIRAFETQAVDVYSRKLISSTLSLWVDKFRRLETMHTQAIALREESVHIAASACLKKLEWRVWTVKRQEENANALRERNFEKHVRAMVRYWWDQTAERLAQREREASPSGTPRGRFDGNDGDDNNDADEGHEAEQDSRGQATAGNSGEQRGERGADADPDSTMLDNPGDVTSQLESWTPFNNHTLGLRDLDLSFTVSPERQPRSLGAASASARRPAPRRAQMHSARQPRTDPRPRAQLQPRSILRSRLRAPRFSPINEHPDPDPEAEAEPTSLDLEDLDTELDPAANNTFWTSTPMPPRTLPVPVSANQNTISRPAPAPATTGQKPGYLKTPSKRSVVRERIGTAGTITKTPGAAGVSSFQERLREGGLV